MQYTYYRTWCLRLSSKTDDSSFPFPTNTPMEGAGFFFYVVTRTGAEREKPHHRRSPPRKPIPPVRSGGTGPEPCRRSWMRTSENPVQVKFAEHPIYVATTLGPGSNGPGSLGALRGMMGPLATWL
jgi:hypothetical protein